MTETRVVVKAAVLDAEGKVLLLRRSDTDTRRPLQWDIPGGGVDHGEQPLDAIARELHEETGLQADTSGFRLVHSHADDFHHDDAAINVIWLFYIGSATAKDVRLSYEHDRYEWVGPGRAPQMIEYPLHKEFFARMLRLGLLEQKEGSDDN